MTRSDLIKVLVKHYASLNAAVVDRTVRDIIEMMNEALEKEDRIEIRGFGTFEVRRYNPRLARNPRTGEEVQLPARRGIHFKPGVILKERVDNLKANKLNPDIATTPIESLKDK